MEPNRLLSQFEFLDNRITEMRERAHLANSELTNESLKTLNDGLEEIGIVQQELLDEVKQLTIMQSDAEEEKERYHDIFEFAPDGYVITDLDGNIREANQSSAAVFNVSKQSLIGKSLMIFVENQAAEQVGARLRTLPSEPQDFELQLRRIDGTVVDVVVSVSWISGNSRG
jgi:two-component system cell cycle sensor histidine kinase/response regulator CckA